jgi:4-diphosphocytidyl-2-C-methyl-D-erythritol kinase
VTAALVERAPAKINLTLRVLGPRPDGFHELESLVAFADLADTLTLRSGGDVALDIAGPFASACGPAAGNLVLKAVAALRERAAGLTAGHFSLKKNIPVAAGLGGGSADAAAALRLLARVNGFGASDPRLAAAALAVGADVPVCLASCARIMRGVGDLLSEPLPIAAMPAVLVNPNVPLSTRDVFTAFAGNKGGGKYLGNVPAKAEALIGFLAEHGNDLTQGAIACAPVITDVLIALRALPAVQLVRMSGSGPTCFALFRSSGEAFAAARRLQAERKEWWVCATTIG